MIERIWAMPSADTFTIKPIKELLGALCIEKGIWADPFAGFHSPAQLTNDLNPDAPTTDHDDALDWLRGFPSELFDGVLYDPPYSYRQASESYKSFGREQFSGTVTNARYWAQCKKEVARLVKPGGIVVCCGWRSGGIGKSNGFEMTRVLLVPHGGDHNDTIVTVEVRSSSNAVPQPPISVGGAR